nr:PREDICTED: niban-like protein 1 [Lepisosteus oculatus]
MCIESGALQLVVKDANGSRVENVVTSGSLCLSLLLQAGSSARGGADVATGGGFQCIRRCPGLCGSCLSTGRLSLQARTGEVMGEFGRLYEQQYAVALFNKVRYEIEGNGGPQSQLLHRKVPLEDKSIFSGNLFQFLEENKKWRNRFLYVPDSYSVMFYETKLAYDRGLHPKGTINCAGYKVLTSVEEYGELMNSSLPGLKAKAGSSMFSKCATQFPIILWHPYARHHYFCVTSEKEHQKWLAVFQDCVRHTNNGEAQVQVHTRTRVQYTPARTPMHEHSQCLLQVHPLNRTAQPIQTDTKLAQARQLQSYRITGAISQLRHNGACCNHLEPQGRALEHLKHLHCSVCLQ